MFYWIKYEPKSTGSHKNAKFQDIKKAKMQPDLLIENKKKLQMRKERIIFYAPLQGTKKKKVICFYPIG